MFPSVVLIRGTLDSLLAAEVSPKPKPHKLQIHLMPHSMT